MTAEQEEFFASRGGDQDISRDRWGRPEVIPPGGGPKVGYTRCTTFVDVMEDRTNLEKWKLRNAAIGLSLRPDLLLRVASIGPDQPEDTHRAKVWKAQHDEAAKAALEAAKASSKATIGTSLHAFTEKIDRGEPVGPVPAEYLKHLRSYEAATSRLTARYIEKFSVYDPFQIGGTPDRVVEVDGLRGLFIADVKSGSVSFPHKMAMQLSVYAHSMIYNPTTGERTDLSGEMNLDRGIIIALDQATGECQLHWIDLARAWDAVQVAAQVRAWRKERGLTKPLLTVAPEQAAAPLVEATAEPSPQAINPGSPAQPGASVDGGNADLNPPATRGSGRATGLAPEQVTGGFPLTAPEVAAALPIADVTHRAVLAAIPVAIRSAETREQLVVLWKAANERGIWTAEHTALSKARQRDLT